MVRWFARRAHASQDARADDAFQATFLVLLGAESVASASLASWLHGVAVGLPRAKAMARREQQSVISTPAAPALRLARRQLRGYISGRPGRASVPERFRAVSCFAAWKEKLRPGGQAVGLC